MEINGLMIDCARLLELPQYYYRLLEFMAQWKMNTLILHFSDDHGCALNLPGFENLAVPKAWKLVDLQEFLSSAASLGIEVIPELETFGHTRYITDKPEYRHLSAGKRTKEIHFNAIDPLHEDTHDLMFQLIQAVANAFPSRYIHIGCDEVDKVFTIAKPTSHRSWKVKIILGKYLMYKKKWISNGIEHVIQMIRKSIAHTFPMNPINTQCSSSNNSLMIRRLINFDELRFCQSLEEKSQI